MGTYVSLDQLRALPRLQDDVAVEGIGTFRVQALTDAEFRDIRRKTNDKELGEYDNLLGTDLCALYGLVEPNLHPHDDEDAAMAVLLKLPIGAREDLAAKVMELTRRPKEDVLRSFFPAPAATGQPW